MATVATDGTGEINIKATYGGGLDMRAAVGHLTRNIKIRGSTEDNWGGHFFVYHWIDDTLLTPVDARGSIVLDSVELINMG